MRDLYANNPSRARAGEPGPGTVEILDALHRLHFACQDQLYNRPHDSRGREEFIAAMRQARQVLQRTRKYGEAP